jgi:hypothetical protein
MPVGFSFSVQVGPSLARMFHELLSRDHETGNPLVADAACGAGLRGAQRTRTRWACLPAIASLLAQARRAGHLATVARYRGIGSEPYLNGTLQGELVLPVPPVPSLSRGA